MATTPTTLYSIGHSNVAAERLIAPALISRGVLVWHIMTDGGCERGDIEPQQMRMF